MATSSLNCSRLRIMLQRCALRHFSRATANQKLKVGSIPRSLLPCATRLHHRSIATHSYRDSVTRFNSALQLHHRQFPPFCPTTCGNGYRVLQRASSQYVASMRYQERLREDNELCEQARRSGLFAVFCNLEALCKVDPQSKRMKLVWKTAEEMEEVLALSGSTTLQDAVLVSSMTHDINEPARFALNVPCEDGSLLKTLEAQLNGETLDIRRAVFTVDRTDITGLLQAYAILQWHSLQGFCSKCGGSNQKNVSGSRRMCASCSQVHYPTMKPIVITLVVDDGRCLVARQPQFPSGMYSALAGFCDIGETLEAAVRREVAEEVGLEVGDISYVSSQHWPMPSSGLMLGCYATLREGSVKQVELDTHELEDAMWLSKQEVQSILQDASARGQRSQWLPPKQAIAHHLLRGWAFSE